MSYQEFVEQCHNIRRTKKKSDDYIKRRSEEKLKKVDPVPVHGIKEPSLADKNFKLPKIPQKHEVSVPAVQLSIAEIIEETDHIIQAKLEQEQEEQPVEFEIDPSTIVPVLTLDELALANAEFALKQKVSIAPLIKLVQSSLDGKQVSIKLTKQQEELLGDIKISWQAHLRQYFKDNTITLQIVIDDHTETKRQAYTASEQFKEMMDSNDIFRTLVNTFKLKLKQ